MKLIDLHCDTAYRLFREKELLRVNNLHISLDKLTKYENVAQIMAIYINKKLDDEEGYIRFFESYGYLAAELAENKDNITLIKSGTDLADTWQKGKIAALLCVEDARLLAGKIERLDHLYERGVRFLVLLWGGETCIGGSHNTDVGLTPFGKEVVRRCFELGIVPDISHASEKSADDILELACEYGKPVIASHSNSYTVYSHSRNLRDRYFKAIRELGGIVGISLCKSHLAPDGRADINDIVAHIKHYLSLGGENTISLGCDLDGTDLPQGFYDVTDIEKIADSLKNEGISDDIIENIFWRNAEQFIVAHVR